MLMPWRSPFRRFKILLLLSLLIDPSRASAQETPAPDRWDLSAEFSLTDQSGNRVLRLLTGGFKVAHRQRDEYRLDLGIQTRYGRSEGDLVILSHLGSIGFDLSPGSTWSPFLFADAERDQFKRLDVRLSSGAGAKYTFRLSESGREETSLSLALLHSYERIAPLESQDPEEVPGVTTSHHLARWSLRARTSHELRDGVTLRHTTFYQPGWDQLADYLLRSETGIKILLLERLALSVDYEWKRDSRPPPEVAPNDRLLKTGLIIDF